MGSRFLSDFNDGSIFARLHADLPPLPDDGMYLYLALSFDGVEVEKNVSYTPVVAKVLNLPPTLRGQLGMLWLLAYFPPKVRNYMSMLRPVVEQLARFAPSETPLEVDNAHTGGQTKVWVVLLWNVNDIRGVPNGTLGRHPPCYVGPCNACVIGGSRHANRTVIPGAVRLLEKDHPLRAEYARTFKKFPKLERLSTLPKPARRSKRSALAAGRKVETGASKKDDEAYSGVDVFSELLPYHDKVKDTVYDCSHQGANVLKQSFKAMSNRTKKDKPWFTTAVRTYENETLGRFPALAPNPGKRLYARTRSVFATCVFFFITRTVIVYYMLPFYTVY